MQHLEVGKGFSAAWTITLRDDDGQALANTYDGTEALDLVISDLSGGAVALTDSSVVWDNPLTPTITLTLDDADTASLGPGPRGLSIGLTVGETRVECYRAQLRVLLRPT